MERDRNGQSADDPSPAELDELRWRRQRGVGRRRRLTIAASLSEGVLMKKRSAPESRSSLPATSEPNLERVAGITPGQPDTPRPGPSTRPDASHAFAAGPRPTGQPPAAPSRRTRLAGDHFGPLS